MSKIRDRWRINREKDASKTDMILEHNLGRYHDYDDGMSIQQRTYLQAKARWDSHNDRIYHGKNPWPVPTLEKPTYFLPSTYRNMKNANYELAKVRRYEKGITTALNNSSFLQPKQKRALAVLSQPLNTKTINNKSTRKSLNYHNRDARHNITRDYVGSYPGGKEAFRGDMDNVSLPSKPKRRAKRLLGSNRVKLGPSQQQYPLQQQLENHFSNAPCNCGEPFCHECTTDDKYNQYMNMLKRKEYENINTDSRDQLPERYRKGRRLDMDMDMDREFEKGVEMDQSNEIERAESMRRKRNNTILKDKVPIDYSDYDIIDLADPIHNRSTTSTISSNSLDEAFRPRRSSIVANPFAPRHANRSTVSSIFVHDRPGRINRAFTPAPKISGNALVNAFLGINHKVNKPWKNKAKFY